MLIRWQSDHETLAKIAGPAARRSAAPQLFCAPASIQLFTVSIVA